MAEVKEMEKLPEGWKISSVKDLFIDGRGRVISEEEIKIKKGYIQYFLLKQRIKANWEK